MALLLVRVMGDEIGKKKVQVKSVIPILSTLKVVQNSTQEIC